jgi:hypothetical protein
MFIDADLASGWSSYDCEEPSSVYARMGFIIMYAGSPLLWMSKLQTEVALSTTEEECIACYAWIEYLVRYFGRLHKGISPWHWQRSTTSFMEILWGCRKLQQYLPTSMKKIQEPVNLLKALKMCLHAEHIALNHHFRGHVSNGTLKISLIGTKINK